MVCPPAGGRPDLRRSAPPHVTTTSFRPASSPPVRVLLIDDDRNTLATITRALESAGYQVTETGRGETGVELARQLRPDIVLCDLNMPGMDGYAVLRALKHDPRTAVIPFIFLSGVQDHTVIRRGMGLGADDFLTKPFELHELLDTIKARIERQHQITRKLEDLRVNIALSVPSEFFTPLNTIMGFSMLVLESLRTGGDVAREDLEDAMTNIHHAGEQLLRIGSNYVLYAQLATEQGPATAPVPPLPADEWVARLSRTTRKVAAQHGRAKDLRNDFAEATLAIKAEHLEKLVSELLDNACKFSRPGQPVSVRGTVCDDAYVLAITDAGRGMTAEEIESLGPMVQLNRLQVMQGGVGLGFAISRALAMRYGGSLSARPNEDGRGLTVEVRLPLSSP